MKNLPNENTVEEQHEIHEEKLQQGENEDDDVDDDSDEADGDETGHNRDDIVGNQKAIDVPFEENVWARVCVLLTEQKNNGFFKSIQCVKIYINTSIVYVCMRTFVFKSSMERLFF